jgi:hypothetical protein
MTPSREVKAVTKRIFALPAVKRATLKKHALFHSLPKNRDGFTPAQAESLRFANDKGWNDVFVSLIDRGIDPLLLKTSWVRNYYKWVVWKLCSLDASYPEMAPLLTF